MTIRALAVVASALLLAGCSSRVEPGGVEFLDTRTVRLSTECAHDVSADLEETTEAIIIDRVEGDRYKKGDCTGSVELELEAPLGDRVVIVEGEQWVRVDDDCEIPEFITPEQAAVRQANQPRPCPRDG